MACNYRPVSLTSICCKLLDTIYSSVMVHLNYYQVLTNVQHGFRKHCSCETQLLLTIHDITSALIQGKQVDAVVLDFSKAFEVPHRHLCNYYGIRGTTLLWIKDQTTATTYT